MAQVTMDSKEYLELIAAQRELEQIKRDMVAGFEFKYDADAYQKFRSAFKHVIPKAVQDAIVNKVIDVCVKTPELMQECHAENLTCFDLESMQLSRNWNFSQDKYSVDLLEYPDFQVAYAKYDEQEEE